MEFHLKERIIHLYLSFVPKGQTTFNPFSTHLGFMYPKDRLVVMVNMNRLVG
ncbi:hypothetical protein Hanom_Chr08g00734191 [Helianthus anomalus]